MSALTTFRRRSAEMPDLGVSMAFTRRPGQPIFGDDFIGLIFADFFFIAGLQVNIEGGVFSQASAGNHQS
jgi:hypothetical protein